MDDRASASLIAALQRREPTAWNAVVERHLGEVYGFVFHLVGGDRAAAEELNQEIWLAAVDNIERCDSTRGSFRNWLFGIARRRIALYYRRRATGQTPLPLAEGFGETADPEGGSLLPDELMEQVERASAVRAAMLAMREDRREVLTRKYVDGMSVEEIAARMGRTAKAVESLLSRARDEMRKMLQVYFGLCANQSKPARQSGHERSDRSR